jgi:hypothetical protein
VGGELGGKSGSIHRLGYLFSTLSREGLIADELVLQLATFLRSLDLFLELLMSTPMRRIRSGCCARAASGHAAAAPSSVAKNCRPMWLAT